MRWFAVACAGALLTGACSTSSRTVRPPTTTRAAAGSSSVPSSSPATGTSTTSASTTSASTASASTASGGAAACTATAAYHAGTTRHVLRIDGVTRELLVHVPPHLDRRTMLIVDFHGATSSMQAQEVYSGFDPRADTDGFVVATPNGTVIGGVRQWNFLGAADVDFAVALVHELVAHACVDPHRVFASGISSGGAMTAALACRASATYDGFAPVAADFYVPALCDKARRRPFLVFHGTADPVVPYNGGQVATNAHQPVQPAETTAAKWAAHDGCGASRTDTRLSSEVVRLTWPGCGVPVVMYKIVGGGHTWPGAAIAAPLGRTTHQIERDRPDHRAVLVAVTTP